MQSTITRDKLANKVTEVAGSSLNWNKAIEALCYLVIDSYRAGEPFIDLFNVHTQVAPPMLIENILPKGETVVLFGDGSVGKSMLALHIALCVVSNSPFAGYAPTESGRVLYLDWETQAETHARRMRRLAKGMDFELSPGLVHYRRVSGSLVDQVPQLREYIDRNHIKVCVIDSLAFAAGDEPNDAGVAIKTLNAARALGTSNIAIAHVNKQEATKGGGKPQAGNIFGSIFWRNGPRCTWECRASAQQTLDGEKLLTLFNRKNNDAPLEQPIGIRMTFEAFGGPVTVERAAVASDMQSSISAASRITDALRSGAKTYEDLHEELKIPLNTVKSTLTRLVEQGNVRRLEKGGGTGNASRFGLAAIDAAGIAASLPFSAEPDVPTGSVPNGPPRTASAALAAILAEPVVVPEEDRCAFCPGKLTRYTAKAEPICDACTTAQEPVETFS